MHEPLRPVNVGHMLRRATAVLALVFAGTLLAGCSAIESAVRREGGAGDSSDQSCSPRSGSPSAAPTPTLNPQVAEEVRTAVKAIRALPAVDAVSELTANGQTASPGSDRRDCFLVENHFSTEVTVTMSPGATAAEAGAVPATMANHIAWTGASLTLRVPAGPGHIASVVHYNGTFDQAVPLTTTSDVAAALAVLAATPHVTSLEASIPYTMRVEFGSLTVGVDPADPATLASVRAVIDTTAFADSTLHGSFHNGAKP